MMHDPDTSSLPSDPFAAISDQEFLMIGFCALTSFAAAAAFFTALALA